MSKFKSHVLSFAISLILGSSFQAMSMEPWYQDGQDEQGKIKYKNDSTGQIKWSSEHLNPQASRPSQDTMLWLAHKYTITNSPTFKQFSYHIVTPEGTHGSIMASYHAAEPIDILYFYDRQAIDEASYAQALDLFLDLLSTFLIDFPSFKINVDNFHATLGHILQGIKEEERETHQPSATKISTFYGRIYPDERAKIKGQMLQEYFINLPSLDWTILRRP